MNELEEAAQEFAEKLLEEETASRQEVLEVFLENLDGETRGLLADFFEV